ncbi:hypothetical protein HID58_005479 [Brassica napus]|uniref:Zinc knuckle CX2CX4HX4C domain-containing protein n=1 Tax=Brassica napus TaxID=3708 RepID=A0ABQ8EB35_BRANA|nr:hypothetical protein HID58_005479 [Brassica napus]
MYRGTGSQATRRHDGPLKFECKVGFDNGDVVKVTIQYEDLYRYCFSCKRLSHEEGTCPDLNDEQREGNRLSRIAQHDLEERATREAFSLPQRPRAGTEKESHDTRSKGQELRRAEANPTEFRRGNHHEGTDKNSQDLRRRLLEKRDTMSKNVWNRLDHVKDTQHEPLQNRVRYHPYNRQTGAYSRDTQRETVSSSEWRPKDVGRNTYGREADKWYERQSDKHWERSRTTTSRNRRSPDSQRTVSDYRKNDAKAYYRGRNSRSPPSNRMEWRPVDRARETGTSRGLLKRSNAPEETKSSGGLAPEREGARRSLIESPQADMEVEKSPRQDAENRGTKGGAENETSMTPTEKEGPILDKGQGSNEQSGKTQEETPQQRKDREDRELEQSISELHQKDLGKEFAARSLKEQQRQKS